MNMRIHEEEEELGTNFTIKRLKYSIGSSKFAMTKYTNSEHRVCIENKLYTSMRQIIFIAFT